MADKQCPQCSEPVDEAKAFCPACGHALVNEEQRTDSSAYEKMDSTVQMGQTMYNNMLSDMGLNLKRPEGEKKVEVLRPVATQPAQVLQPVGGTQASQPPAPAEKKSNTKVWVITIVVAAVLLLLFIAALALVGLYLYFRA